MALELNDPINPSTLTGPATRSIVSADETVSGQMDKILASNSPLLQRAKTRAAQAANSRGLLNSSMGVQAGEEAVLTTAMPMAQQDAATYNKQGLTNQTAANQFGLSNQNFQQQTGKGAYADTTNPGGLLGANLANQLELQTAQNTFATGEKALDRSQQTSMQTGQNTFASGESALGRAQQTSLQDDQQTFATDEKALDRTQQTTTLSQQHTNAVAQAKNLSEYETANITLQGSLQTALSKLGQTNSLELTKLNADLGVGKLDAQVYANTRGAYLQSVSELVRQSQITVGELQVKEGISAEDKAKMMADQATLLTSHLAAQKTLYSSSATWSKDWAKLPSAGVEDNKTRIDNLYQRVLGRPAGEAGQNYYGPRLATGMTDAELTAILQNSEEFRNKT
tara:strand:+ start:767 stop:1957 length:1191 start_codon:yes stop_codon:yes gene_type:complete